VSIFIKNLSKSFGDLPALKDITLTLENSSITSIVGPNGSGKTTLLKCIGTLLTADGGEIEYKGIDKKNIRKNISFVLEGSKSLYNNLTVWENIRYFLEIKRTNFILKQKEVNYYLELFDLINKKKTLVSNLSTGMRQKVSIIIALVQDSKILLLDEPSLGLDFESVNMLKTALKKMKDEKIIIITSHDISLIEDISDYIVVLDKGILKYKGEMKEFKSITKNIKISIELDRSPSDDFKIKLMNYSNRLECENNFIKGIVSINTLNDLLEEIALSKYKIKNLETNATFEDNFCSILNS
jgi:ABC-2 type transport system ATP-binding protein